MFNRVHGPGSFPNGISRPEARGDLPLELRELLEQQDVSSPAATGPENRVGPSDQWSVFESPDQCTLDPASWETFRCQSALPLRVTFMVRPVAGNGTTWAFQWATKASDRPSGDTR